MLGALNPNVMYVGGLHTLRQKICIFINTLFQSNQTNLTELSLNVSLTLKLLLFCVLQFNELNS